MEQTFTVFTQIRWSQRSGNCGEHYPVLHGTYRAEEALATMRELRNQWNQVQNKTDMPEEYRDWKYTDHQSLHIYAVKTGDPKGDYAGKIPLDHPCSWGMSRKMQRAYARAKDISQLQDLLSRARIKVRTRSLRRFSGGEPTWEHPTSDVRGGM